MSDFLDELRASARQVVEGAGLPAWEETTWPLIGELGWLLAGVPEKQDGLDLGVQGVCALHTELGRGLSQAPFLTASLAIDAVCQSELPDRAVWVQRLTTSDWATTSLAEPDIILQGSAAGESLTGTVTAVPSANRARHALVWTRDATCIALLSLSQAGIECAVRPTWDATRRLFDLRLTDVVLSEQTVLARGDAAGALIVRLQALRDFALAADSLGAAAALLEMTVEHLQTRTQFGRPLAMFQALKHRCADLKTMLSAAESLQQGSLLQTADDTVDSGTHAQAQKTKYLACATFSRVAEEALQLHGGIGMAAEHPCHLFLKRAMLNEHLGTHGGHYEAEIAASFLKAM